MGDRGGTRRVFVRPGAGRLATTINAFTCFDVDVTVVDKYRYPSQNGSQIRRNSSVWIVRQVQSHRWRRCL